MPSPTADGPRLDPARAWIACVAAVFAHYGHPVPQARIVGEAYGNIGSVPSGGGFAMSSQLARMWTDDRGVMTRIGVEALYDGSLPNARLDPSALLDVLAAGDPIIVWMDARPFVLAELDIARTDDAWAVNAGRVFDPVTGPGVRDLGERDKRLHDEGDPRSFAMRVAFPGLG